MLRVRACKKTIWGGCKRRDFFFCLETSNGSWLTLYTPSLIYGKRHSKDY